MCMWSWKTHSHGGKIITYHQIENEMKYTENFSRHAHTSLFTNMRAQRTANDYVSFQWENFSQYENSLPKNLPNTYENLKRIFHSFRRQAATEKYKVKTLKGKFFKHFHYAPAQKSLQFEFPQFFASRPPSSILCRHTDERKKKSSNISRVVVEFSRREKQERPGEILKINLIIAIAITESVASHRIFLPVQNSHTHPPVLSLFPSSSGPAGSRERAPHPLKISSSSPTL